jgi:shikimate dehydrogenase
MNNRLKSSLYGLIGHPVKHSLSPAMHNAAFRALGIKAEYRLFEVKPSDLESFLLNKEYAVKDVDGNSYRAGDICGFNITIPHKVRAKEILEAEYKNISPQAQKYSDLVGAVNTVKLDNSGIIWHNSDAPGFIKALKQDLNFEKNDTKDALIFGCGGAGRAVISGLCLADNGMVRNIYVYEVNPKVEESARTYYGRFSPEAPINQKLKFISAKEIPAIINDCCLLVNATPIGMYPSDKQLIQSDLLYQGLFVYDVVYNRETEFIKAAGERGCIIANGAGMLLHQAALAWELWTGEDAPLEVMRKALEKELQ